MRSTIYYKDDDTSRPIGTIESSDPLYENKDYMKSFLSFIELCECNRESFIYNNLIGEEKYYMETSLKYNSLQLIWSIHFICISRT